jgi:hypothetical protein
VQGIVKLWETLFLIINQTKAENLPWLGNREMSDRLVITATTHFKRLDFIEYLLELPRLDSNQRPID